MQRNKIMVVEDEAVIGLSIVEKLKSANYDVVEDSIIFTGKEAIEKANKYHPDLILMDIVLKGKIDGIEAAKKINAKHDIPIIYVTAYADKKLLKRAKITKPSGYIVKPFTDRELFSNIEIALYKHEIEQSLKKAHQKLQTTFLNTIEVIADIIEIKTAEFGTHQRGVAELAVAIATEMQLDKECIETIRIASLIHGIGLIGISNELLRHAKEFSAAERKYFKQYPKLGYDILKKIGLPWPVDDIVLQHRELLDGSGFPAGLKKKDICLEAKIISVAHFVEISTKGYLGAKKLSQNKVFQHLKNNSNKLYDPKVVKACLKVFKTKNFKIN